jgi:hypothetical protein
MFGTIGELYVKYGLIRWVYQLGFLIAWAIWAHNSLQEHQATWLVFGWLPAVFWPVQLIAFVLARLYAYHHLTLSGLLALAS